MVSGGARRAIANPARQGIVFRPGREGKAMLNVLLVAGLSGLWPKSDGRTLDEKCPPLTRLTLGLKGRILGSFIERGMTKERVEGILPKDAAFLPTGSVAGGCLWWDVGYTDLKLDIHFFSANGEEL